MELPPPHVLLQLDAIIVAQRESESLSDGNSPPPVMAPPAPPPASTPRALGTPPAPRAVVPRDAQTRPRAVAPRRTYPCPASCGCGLPHRRCGECAPCRAKQGDACLAPRPGAPAPQPATRRHVASTASAWVTVCTDLLEALKDRTNMRGLHEPLVSRGFICGAGQENETKFAVTVPQDFPCYYDVTGKDYVTHDYAQSLSALRKYLEGALALARTGGAYRTEAEYKQAPAPVPAARPAPVRAPKTSRFTGVHRHRGKWTAQLKLLGSKVHLGDFDEEEDAARAYDAALVEYRNEPAVNFPGEAPLASVLAALPPTLAAAATPRRSGRAPAPKVIVDPEAPTLRATFSHRSAKRMKFKSELERVSVEGGYQKQNGKWANNHVFPGREFDNLDEYLAAKKQHAEQRIAYSDQNIGRRDSSSSEKWSSLRHML